MRCLTETRTARRPHRCEDCGQTIRPGEQYDRHAMPPGGEMGNVGWWHFTTHQDGECPSRAPAGGDGR